MYQRLVAIAALRLYRGCDEISVMTIKVALEHRTSYPFDRPARENLELSDIREMQAPISTGIGAPGILDLRRVRTVLR